MSGPIYACEGNPEKSVLLLSKIMFISGKEKHCPAGVQPSLLFRASKSIWVCNSTPSRGLNSLKAAFNRMRTTHINGFSQADPSTMKWQVLHIPKLNEMRRYIEPYIMCTAVTKPVGVHKLCVTHTSCHSKGSDRIRQYCAYPIPCVLRGFVVARYPCIGYLDAETLRFPKCYNFWCDL